MNSNFQSPLQLMACIFLGCLSAVSAYGGVPDFLDDGLYSPNSATVAEVVPSLSADVVILEGGLEQGIRLGMVCRVTRGTLEVGELVVIKSNRDRAAALILSLYQDNVIQPGDLARLKTIQNS